MFFLQLHCSLLFSPSVTAEMCSERDSPLKHLYRWTHAKLTRLAGFGQLVWAAGCELSLALVHARRPAWPGATSETILRVASPRKTRPPDHTRVNWPVDASASGSAQVGSGGRHRWAARVQVGREPARQKAREGYPSHYTSLVTVSDDSYNCRSMCSAILSSTHPATAVGGARAMPHGGENSDWVLTCSLQNCIFLPGDSREVTRRITSNFVTMRKKLLSIQCKPDISRLVGPWKGTAI